MWFSETEYDEAFGVCAFQAHCSKQQCPVLPAGSTLRRHCPHAVAAAVAFVHVVAATLRLAVAAQASGTSFVMDASSAGRCGASSHVLSTVPVSSFSPSGSEKPPWCLRQWGMGNPRRYAVDAPYPGGVRRCWLQAARYEDVQTERCWSVWLLRSDSAVWTSLFPVVRNRPQQRVVRSLHQFNRKCFWVFSAY